MFSINRIIAIDDEQLYLDQLCKALYEAGVPCVPMKYPEQQPPEDGGWCLNARVIFCDLHLLPSARNQEQSYGAIGTILERIIPAGGGPLVLILWTNYPEEANTLKAYLSERFPKDKQPTEIVPLPKASFIGENGKNLPSEIRKKLELTPQLRALLEWENDVSIAASNCVRRLFQLASSAGETLDTALDELLSQLAQAASGKKLASENPGSAIHEALLPLLSDGILHLPDDAERVNLWKVAMPTAVNQRKINCPAGRAAAINAALNFVYPSAQEIITAKQRGAVTELEDRKFFATSFSKNENEIIENFAFEKLPDKFRWVTVQVEATCDYAQQKSACIPCVLAIEAPAAERTKSKSQGRPDSIWESPAFISEKNEEVKLVANVRYVILLSPDAASNCTSIYRLRDPLVNDLSFAKARHETRPGYIALR